MDSSSNYWDKYTRARVSRRRLLGGAVIGGLSAVVVACGGGGSKSTGGTPSGGTQTPLTQGGVTTFQNGNAGGKLNVGVTLEPGTLDTAVPLSGGDTVFLATMYNPLLTLDHFVPNPQLSLAQKFEVADPQTVNFTLRQGVKFHDGTDFNADAVKANFTRILDPATKSAARSSLTDIDMVTAVDPTTVTMKLKQPNAAILTSLATVYGAGMASPTAVQKYGKDFTSHPVGTGPFVFDEWVPGSHVTVKRNPNYWEKDGAGRALPYVDQVTIQAIQDDTVRYANLQTGDVHMAGINTKDWAAAAQNPDLLMVQGLPGIGVPSVLVFNLDKPPANNLNIRKAMAFALDPSVVAKNIYFGYAQAADSGMRQPGSWSYAAVPGRPKYDPTQAKQLLSAAGQPDGFSIDVITYTSPTINQQTEVYQEQWSKVGIKAQITTQDVTTATDSFFKKGLFPAYSTSWGGTSFEPNGPTILIYTSDAYYNPMARSISPELDMLAAKGRATYDLQERQKIYQRIDEIVLVEQCFFIPMLYSQSEGFYRKNVGNADSYTWFGFNRLQNIFLKS